MNTIWFLMMAISFITLLWTSPQSILPIMISSSQSALSLAFELCSVYVVWIGILELIDASGLGDKLAKILRPLIRKIFGKHDEETEKYIALNISSNILGLGNASTPMGIKALTRLEDGSKTVTAGSTNPSDIIIPSIIATFCTFCLGIILGKICEKIYKKIKK